MTQLFQERRILLTDLAKREDVNVTTAWRWAEKGVRGVKLESFYVGGRRYTSEEAFVRFNSRITMASRCRPDSSPLDYPATVQPTSAETELDKLGIEASPASSVPDPYSSSVPSFDGFSKAQKHREEEQSNDD